MRDEFLIKASAQYNDAIGTVAADLKDSIIGFDEFLDKLKFDSHKYFSFYYSFTFGEPSPVLKRSTYFNIYAVKKDEVGETYTQLMDYLDKNNNDLPIYKFSSKLTANEFFDLFKRFEIAFSFLKHTGSYYADTINENIIDEIDL